jgi:hypothetical protein
MTRRPAVASIAALLPIALGCTSKPSPPAASSTTQTLRTADASFELRVQPPLLTISTSDGFLSQELDLSLVIDEGDQSLDLSAHPLEVHPDGIRAVVPITLEGAKVDADLELRADTTHDAVVARLGIPASPGARSHRFALRASTASDNSIVFVSGVGTVSERANVSGDAVLLDTEPHPLAIGSALGPVNVETISEESLAPGEPLRVAIRSPPATATDHPFAELHFAVGQSSQTVWRDITALSGRPSVAVRGHVTGVMDRAYVVGRDASGAPLVRARTSVGGAFALEVPPSVVQWYAETSPGPASGLTTFAAGSAGELILDVPPEGDVHVAVLDADKRTPLTARLLFHGLGGTVDPNFGPDYRASGAGPIVDSLRGDATASLPPGRYRIAATKGIEWSIDAREVDVTPGHRTEVTLALRHVVPTPGTLGCDLHVHARPSFDAPVTPEDRVLSLVAAGVDFAVPTEHNIVGDYASAIETLDLGREFLSVTGVEVTTYDLGFGHFGVFPYPPSVRVPPFEHTNMSAIFRAVRTSGERYFQLNHPRLPGGIGYLNNIGFDPHGSRSQIQKRVDFDGIEVYNGFDIRQPDRVEQVLHDYWALLDYGWRYTATGSSDSHRIQYQWAGYPRTMVTVNPAGTVDADALPADPMQVVENLKRGHATVTSGPILELALGDARPGDEVVTTADPLAGHLRVRAAPWIDVTRVEIVVGQIGHGWTVVRTFDVPSRPTTIGSEGGTLEEAQERTIRFDADIAIPVGDGNGWVVAVARGARLMSDVLPFVPVAPLGFTDPVYVVRLPVAPPPFPAGGRRPPP